jgi:integrase
MRLTKPNVNGVKIPHGKAETIVFDDQLPGFGVRLRAGGKRTWIVQYRVGAKQRRVTLGSVEALDPDEARKRAKSVFAKVHLGRDPQVEKLTTRAKLQDTLGNVIAKYLSAYAEKNLRPKTLIEVRRNLMVSWRPLHEAPAHSLKRSAVANRLAEIAEESGPIASNRARAYLAAMFSWAIEQGIVDVNPVIGTGKVTKETSRDRVLTDRELAIVWRQAGYGDYGVILKLLILTGQRREEVAAMAWSEIDLATGLWSIPANRTKNGRIHDVPLSVPVLSLLRNVEMREGRELVFGRRNGPFSGWSNAKSALDARITTALQDVHPKAKPLPQWCIHDVRRTVATRMADIGVQPHVVEAILNHVSGNKSGVAGIYNRATYSAEKSDALTVWGDYVSRLVQGTPL